MSVPERETPTRPDVPKQRDDGPPVPPGVSMPETRPELMRQGWLQKRREKVIAEIERNRRGDYKVPTWVLAVALVAVVTGWLLLVFLNG